jgi:SAM-dependent methyltransferase
LLRILEERRYARALEIGCNAAYFTHLLAGVAEQIVALDISPTTIARARGLWTGPVGVDFRVANIMEYDMQADGPRALVVLSDTICMLGWLYPFFDVAWLAARLFAASAAGGRLLLANSICESNELLLLPWLIRTYRDLFRNVGYELRAEEIFRGNKNGVDFEVLISLFAKGHESGP